MQALIFLPFVIQALCIFFDEFFYHLKRGLPLWERIGHPLDTLSVLACFVFVLKVPQSSKGTKLYVVIALISCFLITKDEFVHKELCSAPEQWLHSLLFINHSLMLCTLGLLRPSLTGKPLFSWLPPVTWISPFLWGQTVLIASFFLYQIIYWNLIL